MGDWKNWLRRASEQLTAVSWSVRVSAALLATLVVGSLVWMALAGGQARVALAPVPTDAAVASDLLDCLNSRGLDARIEDGSVTVPADQVARARSALNGSAAIADAGPEPALPEPSIWLSQAQSEKRWQAFQTARLGYAIARFPAVRSATVFYEPGSRQRLGGPAVAATAAVNVTLHEGQAMTPALVDAIADNVAGGFAALDRQNIRVVDASAGVSYRPGDGAGADSQAALAQLERIREQEQHLVGKIESALAFAHPLVAGVHVSCEGNASRCVSASLSLPRSYLLRVARAGGIEPEAGTLPEEFVSEQLESARQSVMRVTGIEDPSAVNVDWYYDQLAASDAAPLTAETSWPVGWWLWAAGALVAAGLLALAARRPRRAAAQEQEASDDQPAPAAGHFDVSDLADKLAGEHPQTAALTLAQMPPSRAAAVLGALPGRARADVIRRLATLDVVDPEVGGEVRRLLLTKADDAPFDDGRSGGSGTVAAILRHAPGALGQSLSDALDERHPGLAGELPRDAFTPDELLDCPAAALRAGGALLDAAEVALALHTAERAVRKRLLAAMGSAAAKTVRQELASLGPVRLAEVEAAQRRLIGAVREAMAGRYEQVGQPAGRR